MDLTDPQVDAIVHSQKIARKIGSAQMAVDVYGWAINNAMSLTNTQLGELLDIVSKEPA